MFSGKTYNESRDGARLGTQFDRVKTIMSDGQWHTLPELVEKCGGTEAAISARIRDFRKPRFGGHAVQREYVRKGLWRYRLVVL